jgi:hypothetical protein
MTMATNPATSEATVTLLLNLTLEQLKAARGSGNCEGGQWHAVLRDLTRAVHAATEECVKGCE